MPRRIEIQIVAEVADGQDPRFVAFQCMQQLSLRSRDLGGWQDIYAPIGDRFIGRSHFAIIEE